jgi:hypothetical protein
MASPTTVQIVTSLWTKALIDKAIHMDTEKRTGSFGKLKVSFSYILESLKPLLFFALLSLLLD